MLASERKPSYWRAKVAEYDAMATSDNQLRKLRRPFGDIPVVVLTRSVSPYAVPGKPQSAANKAFEDENFQIQKEFTKLTNRGTQRVVAGAGHTIQADKPEAVVDAVLEVLKQVRH
jgi:pimeloyl-ACP methyl ester carboxylesterase